MIIERNGTEERHSFWGDTQAEEPRLFQQFLDVVAHFDDYRLYSYGSYEAAFLRRMIKESGRHDLAEKILIALSTSSRSFIRTSTSPPTPTV